MKMEDNRMTAGTGEDSYACNSLIQAVSITKVFPVVKDALEELYSTMSPKCVMVAELGCATGPNSLLLLPQVLDITYKTMTNNYQDIPEVNLFLNDLPVNDFNSICTSLPKFLEELERERKGGLGPCFISATPGSYYKRLFPSNFLHFVHCSNSAHWLSQVPKGLLTGRSGSMNKGNIYIAETSPPEVIAAYRDQFEEDFTSFLKSRAHEIVVGGRMVLNIMESTISYGPPDYFMTKLLNMALKDMVTKGLIEAKKMDNFEVPFYPPTTQELEKFIKAEGSFYLHKHKHFTLDWDVNTTNGLENGDKKKDHLFERAKFITGPIRTGSEYMFASHFGHDVMDDLYSRVIELVAERLSCGKLETFHHAICLVKK